MEHCFDWAAEMGIDVEKVKREHPMHPIQLRNHRRIIRQGEKYWAKQRFLDLVEYSSKAIFSTPVVEPVKIPKKRTKVRRYEFTDAQMQIALRSLDAGGAV